MKSAANIRSICNRAFAFSIRNPRPLLAPTHSPTMAPIGAIVAATRMPAPRDGRADGILIFNRVWKRLAFIVLARSK